MKTGLLAFVFLLASCSSMHVRIHATSSVNRDQHDVPQSVALHVFQLKDIAAFNSARLVPLFDNPSEVLGGDMLSDRELFIQPGQQQYFSASLLPGAKFIGVVAAFRHHQRLPWRQFAVIKAENRYTNERIYIQLSAAGLKVK